MRVVVSEFMSLDGVVQAPGGADEDTSGGFRHGGWSIKFFDPEVMGAVVDEFAERSEVLLQGRRTYQVSAAAWPEPIAAGSRTGSTRTEVRRVGHALRRGSDVEADDDHPRRRPRRGGLRAARPARRRHLRLRQPVVARVRCWPRTWSTSSS